MRPRCSIVSANASLEMSGSITASPPSNNAASTYETVFAFSPSLKFAVVACAKSNGAQVLEIYLLFDWSKVAEIPLMPSITPAALLWVPTAADYSNTSHAYLAHIDDHKQLFAHDRAIGVLDLNGRFTVSRVLDKKCLFDSFDSFPKGQTPDSCCHVSISTQKGANIYVALAMLSGTVRIVSCLDWRVLTIVNLSLEMAIREVAELCPTAIFIENDKHEFDANHPELCTIPKNTRQHVAATNQTVCCRWAPDGMILAVKNSSEPNNLLLWSAASLSYVSVIVHHGPLRDFKWSPHTKEFDTQLAVSVEERPSLFIWSGLLSVAPPTSLSFPTTIQTTKLDMGDAKQTPLASPLASPLSSPLRIAQQFEWSPSGAAIIYNDVVQRHSHLCRIR